RAMKTSRAPSSLQLPQFWSAQVAVFCSATLRSDFPRICFCLASFAFCIGARSCLAPWPHESFGLLSSFWQCLRPSSSLTAFSPLGLPASISFVSLWLSAHFGWGRWQRCFGGGVERGG